jgi:DNA-binding response OmpR family regulator/two-component sensor histidine kinase
MMGRAGAGTAAIGEILIVEDTPASLKLLGDLLSAAGYLVRQAPDGELALWSAGARPPELILLDIRMPGMDGFEVCRRLKETPPLRDIPVIFLSAQYDTDDKVRGFQAGAVDFIAKPYQPEEVLVRAQVHIRLARTQLALEASNAELGRTVAQLRSARAEVERAERLAALGALVAGVAHELNTPIGNSVLAASSLDDRTRNFMRELDAGVRRSDLEQFAGDACLACTIVLRNLGKASELIDSFKQVAVDQTSSQRRSFDLARLIDDLALAVTPSLRGTGVDLLTDAEPALTMDSYPGALCQVVTQFVRNALVHAFAQGGPGCMYLRARGIDTEWLELEFTDDGRGIDAASVGKVFDPFFTTQLGKGGSGLGLNIVHNLVGNVLGGAIAVDSMPGRTCFRLRLPRRAPTLAVAPGSVPTSGWLS